MAADSNNPYLYSNALTFGQNTAQTIMDMTGQNFAAEQSSIIEGAFNRSSGMTVSIPFAGTIQGTYILTLQEQVAAAIIGEWQEGMEQEALQQLRGDTGGFIKELLNIAVGQSIVELEKNFGDLTFSPATVVYGIVEYPEVRSGQITIKGDVGIITCAFSLNLANIRIGQKLEEALAEIALRTREAEETKRNIQTILATVPSGLLSIDLKGIILPGYSTATLTIIDADPSASVAGTALTSLLHLSEEKAKNFEMWLDIATMKFKEIAFADIAQLCDINELILPSGKEVTFTWVPITLTEGGALEKMIVILEDVTEQRELHRKMDDLSKQHQQNLELISQIINLEPDEITQFVYDTSQLLSDAQRLIKTSNRDSEFVNELFRTFHTIKGSSGQFQFKELQGMAHRIEDELRQLRDQYAAVDDQSVTHIEQSLKEVGAYVNRIQDIRTKLGGKSESIEDKARRREDTIMVNLSIIDSLLTQSERLRAAAQRDELGEYYQERLGTLHNGIAQMRQVHLSFFLSSLQSLADNTCSRTGKKVSLAIAQDRPLDIMIMRQLHPCLIHLLNNAIDHGLEAPEQRLANNKQEVGLIVLDVRKDANATTLSIADDGQGISLERIRQKVIANKMLPQEAAEELTRSQLYEYLLRPGFSTKEQVTEISGRGVGMDVVGTTIKKLNGKIIIESVEGKGTTIRMVIPHS